MKNTKAMSRLAEGEKGTVEQLNVSDKMLSRLTALGLTKETTVECLYKSRRNEIAAYRIRGAVIAVRSEDADKITII